MKLTIASWNILNDHKVPVHATQADRIDIIVSEINNVRQNKKRYVQFLCECQSIENIKEIAEKTNLEIVGEPYKYRRKLNEYFVFLADKETTLNSSVSSLQVQKGRKECVLKLEVGGKSIIGCHMPYRVVFEYILRKNHLKAILNQKPEIFLGDFNATPFFLMRLKIKIKKYIETYKTNRPPFPSPFYRGKNIHWWLPNINIDAIYSKPVVKTIESGYSLNDGSDHPLIWNEVEL